MVVEVLEARGRLEPQVERRERRVDADSCPLRRRGARRLDDVEQMEVVLEVRERRAPLAHACNRLAQAVGPEPRGLDRVMARIDVAFDGGPTDRGKDPFTAILEIFTFDTVAEELVAYEFGETADVTGAWDKTQLRFAQMNASGPIQLFSVDLATAVVTPTGRTAALGSIGWTGAGDMAVYGNDGPVNAESGLSRHFVTRCELLNAHAHQKLRPAEVTSLP